MLHSCQNLINLAMKYTKFHSVDGAAPIVVRKVGRHQDTVAIAALITIVHKADTAEKAKLRSNLGRPNDQRSKARESLQVLDDSRDLCRDFLRQAESVMSQKQRDKQRRREARKQKGRTAGLSPAQRQAAYEERCAKRKAHELKLKEFAEAERARQRAAAQARESALADALASASVPAEGGELRLLGLHDARRYNYPPIVKINDIDFVVAGVRNSDGDTWLSLKPKPPPMPPLDRVPSVQRFHGRLSPSTHLALAAALMLGGLDRK